MDTSSGFLPPVPALIARHGLSSLLTPDGELLDLDAEATRAQLRLLPPPLLVHGPATLRTLALPAERQPVPWLDLLELLLFVHPARNATPTPRGLALALGLSDSDPQADLLPRLALRLLDDLKDQARKNQSQESADETLQGLLEPMERAGWAWAPIVRQVLDTVGGVLAPQPLEQADTSPEKRSGKHAGHEALRVWMRLPQWEETPPRPQPGSQPVTPQAARARLTEMLGAQAEPRPGQADFAAASTEAFAPREMPGMPNVVLAEAGTGTGKTLGYIAPSSVWSETNSGTVWISTYTRHLQRQIDRELERLYPDPETRRLRAVVRKGRENYLCLLNLEEITNAALNRPPNSAQALIPLALLARWAEATSDGDLLGGDLPGWFGELFSPGLLASVADRRGECIHSACPYYQSCFIEHSLRRARQADLVIANHALTLSQAAWNALVPQKMAPGGLSDENGTPTRYVFDEGHHIPSAADSAFSLTFSGLEAAELRRWLLGAEGGRSRARGLKRRMDDVLGMVPSAAAPLQSLLDVAQRTLPRPGWSLRLQESASSRSDDINTFSPLSEDDALEKEILEGLGKADKEENKEEEMLLPSFSVVQKTLENPSEEFLHAMEAHLQARLEDGRANTRRAFQDQQECDLHPVSAALAEATEGLAGELEKMLGAMKMLLKLLGDALENDKELDPPQQQRLEASLRSLYRRAYAPVQGWLAILRTIIKPSVGEPPQYVDFIRQERFPTTRAGLEGKDIGLHRHWLDPTIPFAATLQATTHGLLITSATLRDRTPEESEGEIWQKAEQRVGATHFLKPPYRAALMSPFDYARQTRAYVITDVSNETVPLARAFQQLFECANGSALGLFTAIKRLREVHRRIHEPLGLNGLPLYAQHVDAMSNGTLVDIFRTETKSCLLGTDAMRDGVDVPGEALRMVVFERTPWPRPDILHRERRRFLSEGNPAAYDERITRMRLRQAFGRLIRRADDYGVFVMLDRRTPSRLLTAFPDGVPIQRLPLAEALTSISAFLESHAQALSLTNRPSA